MLPLNVIFWVLIIIWAVFGIGYGFYTTAPNPRIVSGSNLLLLVLFVLLGLRVFGGG